MQEKSTIKQNILKYLDYKGITPYKFYQETGITRGILTQKNGMSEENTTRFLEYYKDVNSEWLITGKGEMLKLESQSNKLKIRSSEIGIPLVPINAIAGMSNGNNNSILTVDCEYYDIPEFRNKADYLIRINGSSMSPKYHSGDIVACKKLPLDTFFQWNKVYVVDTEQGALVKRVKKSPLGAEYIQLISENEKYEPFDIPKSSIHALGLVIGVIRLE